MMKYANSGAPRDGILRLHCLHHEADVFKADSYVITLDGFVLLIDGGMKDSRVTYDFLRELRREWLTSGGEHESCDAPLKLWLLISHFHVDHVSAAIDMLLPDSSFEFEKIYLPPDSALDPYFHTTGKDGDTKYRPAFEAAVRARGFEHGVINVGFGRESILRMSDESGRIGMVIYPPVADGGVGERLEYNINEYWGGDRTHHAVATSAINANSIWLQLDYGQHRFLFTGDTMKREAHLDREAANEMVAEYGRDIGSVDVIKYLHHGYRRDDAAGLMMSFCPKHIILSCRKEGASAAVRAAFPDSDVQIHNCADRDVLLESNGTELWVTD